MNSPPAGRKEVQVHVGADDDSVISQFIKRELSRDGQVFVVVPFVSEVQPTAGRLQELLPGLRVIEAHGRHDDLEDRIDSFSRRQADVLISTTVIETKIFSYSISGLV